MKLHCVSFFKRLCSCDEPPGVTFVLPSNGHICQYFFLVPTLLPSPTVTIMVQSKTRPIITNFMNVHPPLKKVTVMGQLDLCHRCIKLQCSVLNFYFEFDEKMAPPMVMIMQPIPQCWKLNLG